ncbi:2-hydroxyacid dehydrogenase [Mesorhizobium sp. VK9D]|uniref:2-hydroxyacid dehydrogenase n=1 Tax=Mesorhizobium australafricanum TaxID=3072311 RepID=UPI002A24C3C8|nr:2-hydroxyacid dehydrogenase [Mesorhizobium sp. VK9D]MDX8454262.1 2-hydroxyacid dehydrogenase [Mesorhizobium sp. VK9D]
MSKLKIAAVGDQFIGMAVFDRALKAVLADGYELDGCDSDWPDVPFFDRSGPAGPEIAEYSGKPEDIEAYVMGADVLLTHLGPISRSLIERAPKLKFIGVTRGGPVNIDMAAAREKGIRVANVPGRNATAVAEFTIGEILACTRKIAEGHVGMAAGAWRGDLYRYDRTGDELCDLTVGIVGYSHVGQRVVRLLKPFGCKVLVCDPFVKLNIYDSADGVEQTDFDDLIKRSDVVTLHARLTDQTRGMLSKEHIASMKRGAIVINNARGELIDQKALVQALKSGALGGAALDAYEVEPPDTKDDLLTLPNVTLTPHIAGASRRVATYAAETVVADLKRFLEGKPLINECA